MPTATPTQTPTPTAPVYSSSANLAPINDGKWWSDSSWQRCPASNIYYDTSTTHNGSPTWRVQSGTNYGPDHAGISVKPGDHIVMQCWIKTSGTPSGAYSNMGARIGLDYYTAGWGQRIMGCGSPTDASTGKGWPNVARQENTSPTCVVDWGSDWKLITWNFVVPSQAMGDQNNGANIPQGHYAVPGTIVPWCQIYGSYATTYTSWFSDFQLYINP